jgi:5-methylcytosine-specific restriction endonuclease McrA
VRRTGPVNFPDTARLINDNGAVFSVQTGTLSASQKGEILRRQAFKCDQCQTDLEPVGRAPPHFVHEGASTAKGASGTANVRALCPDCHSKKSSSEGAKGSDAKRRRARESDSNRKAEKFVKTGFDNKKF